jgi:predicted AlkP superfamily phosphohydrolase/phosphomutase
MSVPRWTVYPALLLVGALLLIAVAKRSLTDPFEGAARAKAGAEKLFEKPAVVVLGIDGMDPDILKEVLTLYPERMSNFAWLVSSGSGIQNLGTSTPPQSPVAWSNFITGRDPGGHGIFDFIHRDPMTRAPIPSTTKSEEPTLWDLPGKYMLTIGGDGDSNRTGKAFWTVLREHGVPADIWRMPANFPAEVSDGWSFSGMMTPALDSAYGECTLYTTREAALTDLDYRKITLVREYEGIIFTAIDGPTNPFVQHQVQTQVATTGSPQDDAAHDPSGDAEPKGHPAAEHKRLPPATTQAQITIYVDHEADAAAIVIGSETLVMRPGQWSDFVQLEFAMLPMGLMDMLGEARFYLRSVSPDFELYASAVNVDPADPVIGISQPHDASAIVASAIGRFYTQGMPEDVNSLKYNVLSEVEFMGQSDQTFEESNRLLEYALHRYVERRAGGVLFFYYSTVDLCSHMMWRHGDSAHPAHDAAFAAQDSSAWSGRETSIWKETVHDLYLRMDPVLGRIRETLGDDAAYIVMSDHGFASYRRKFSLNTWLYENGYLVLKEGVSKELPDDDPAHTETQLYFYEGPTGRLSSVVDWSKTRAYGIGFNGLYVNLAGRERDVEDTVNDDSGIVDQSEKDALLREIKAKLEALVDDSTGLKPVLRCDLASDIYHGGRGVEAPDLVVGYNAGYGNSDPSSLGRIPHRVLEDNTGGTFNGNHLMAPDVVAGTLITNRPVRQGAFRLEDLTCEILRQYGIAPTEGMIGHPVFE